MQSHLVPEDRCQGGQGPRPRKGQTLTQQVQQQKQQGRLQAAGHNDWQSPRWTGGATFLEPPNPGGQRAPWRLDPQ